MSNLEAVQAIIDELKGQSLPTPWRRKILFDAMMRAYTVGLLPVVLLAFGDNRVVIECDDRTITLSVGE